MSDGDRKWPQVSKWPQVFNLRDPACAPPRSGLPMPVAGRSRMPSWHPLSACPRRFALRAALAPIARLSGTGSPELSPGIRKPNRVSDGDLGALQPCARQQKNSARGFPPGRSSLAEVGQQISVRPIDPQLTCWRPSGPPSPSRRRHRGSAQQHTAHSRRQHRKPAPHRKPARCSRCRPSSRAHHRSSWCRSSSCERAWPSVPRSGRGARAGGPSESRSTKPHRSSARSSQHQRRRPVPHSRCRLRRRAQRNRCQHRKPAPHSRSRHRSRARCSCRSSCSSACTSRTGPSGRRTGRASSGCRSTKTQHRSSARSTQPRRRRPVPHSRCRLRRRAPHNRCRHHSRAPHNQHRRRSRAHSTKHSPCSRASDRGARNRKTGYKR